jgi:hypothetical protein
MFIDDESGVIRVWTVGRENALENRTLQCSGIRALSVVDSKHKQDTIKTRDQVTCLAQASLACVFSDGGLGIYNLRRATWELHKEAVSSWSHLNLYSSFYLISKVKMMVFYININSKQCYFVSRVIQKLFLHVLFDQMIVILLQLAHLMVQSSSGLVLEEKYHYKLAPLVLKLLSTVYHGHQHHSQC